MKSTVMFALILITCITVVSVNLCAQGPMKIPLDNRQEIVNR